MLSMKYISLVLMLTLIWQQTGWGGGDSLRPRAVADREPDNISLKDLVVSLGWPLKFNNLYRLRYGGAAVVFENINPVLWRMADGGYEKMYDYNHPNSIQVDTGRGILLIADGSICPKQRMFVRDVQNCVGISICVPLRNGKTAFFLDHFYERSFIEPPESDDINGTLEEILNLLEKLGAVFSQARVCMAGGSDLGIPLSKAPEFAEIARQCLIKRGIADINIDAKEVERRHIKKILWMELPSGNAYVIDENVRGYPHSRGAEFDPDNLPEALSRSLFAARPKEIIMAIAGAI